MGEIICKKMSVSQNLSFIPIVNFSNVNEKINFENEPKIQLLLDICK